MSGIFRVNQKTHHGLLLMSELAARHATGEVLGVSVFARRSGLSPKFLEQVAAKLKRAGLIAAQRGTSGGYRLTRSPRRISVSDVVTAIDGQPKLVDCLGESGGCGALAGCSSRQVWAKVQRGIERSLKSVSLAEVAGIKRR